MEYIKNRFYEKASKCMAEFQNLRKTHGDVVLGQRILNSTSGSFSSPHIATLYSMSE